MTQTSVKMAKIDHLQECNFLVETTNKKVSSQTYVHTGMVQMNLQLLFKVGKTKQIATE